MRITKGKILVWGLTAILWVLFFYLMTVSDRPAAIELFIVILAILNTGIASLLSLRRY